MWQNCWMGKFSVAVVSCLLASAASAADWPDLSRPARTIGGGEHDAAVVVGVENYFAVPGVPGAKANANGWYEYLAETRGIPPQNVKLLTNGDATRERVLEAARKAAGEAGESGTLWFVFIGHGAPSADGKDGLLVGADAQQEAQSLQERSVRRGELLKTLAGSKAGSIRVVIDACFSGRGQDGASIATGLQPLVTVAAMGTVDPRMSVLTAAKGNQFAGALPGAARPAFSYLVLGGLRGWAAEKDGLVTAGGLLRYAKNALAATLRGRDQTPDLIGAESAVVGASAGEQGPNLAKLAETTESESTSADLFQVSSLSQVPRVRAPGAMGAMGAGADFRDMDVDSLAKYDEATRFDEGPASADEKGDKWRALAEAAPKFAEKANARAAQWDRYAADLYAADEVRQKRDDARDADWAKLGRLLAMKVVPDQDKRRWAAAFVKAYGKKSEDNPYVEELAAYLPPGAVKATPGAKIQPKPRLDPDIRWATLPGELVMKFKKHTGPEGTFSVWIPAAWTVDSAVCRNQDSFCASVFSDPNQPGRKLIAYLYGYYHPVAAIDGRLEMYSSAEDYAGQILEGHKTYGVIESSTHTFETGGRSYVSFTVEEGAGANFGYCRQSINGFCVAGVTHRYAALNVSDGTYHSEHILVLASSKGEASDAAIFDEFVKSYVPVKVLP